MEGCLIGGSTIETTCTELNGAIFSLGPSMPLNVQVTLEYPPYPATVLLAWEPPEHCNGVILSYHIFYNTNSGEEGEHWRTQIENGMSGLQIVDQLLSHR